MANVTCANQNMQITIYMRKESLLQYTMTLLQGPKDPVLPTPTVDAAKHLNQFFFFIVS